MRADDADSLFDNRNSIDDKTVTDRTPVPNIDTLSEFSEEADEDLFPESRTEIEEVAEDKTNFQSVTPEHKPRLMGTYDQENKR